MEILSNEHFHKVLCHNFMNVLGADGGNLLQESESGK